MRTRFGSAPAIVLVATGAAFAQIPGDPQPSSEPAATASVTAESVAESLGDDTPRGALSRFLADARRADYVGAASYLDLSNVPPGERETAGPDLARQLKVVLDRTIWFDLESVSDSPDGAQDDGLPPGADRIGQIEHSGQRIAILMHRVRSAGGERVWKFTPALVERTNSLYAELGYGWLGDHVPNALHRMSFLNAERWQLIGLLALALLAWPLSRLAAAAALRGARSLASRTKTDLDDEILLGVRRPLRWAAWLALLALGVPALDLPVKAEHSLRRGMEGLGFLIVIFALSGAADAFARSLRARLAREGQPSGAGMVALASRAAKILLAFIAVTGLLKMSGFDVSAILAGLGIGGVAVALAAQKTIENLFGGVSVMADKPVRVGDFCKFGDKTGWVDDIGLRSTRVRTPDMTLLTVPNAQFASEQIENFGSRASMRFFTVLGLRYETTPDQLRAVLASLRELFIGHPKVGAEMLRVRFVGLGVSSLDIEVNAYIRTGDAAEFYAVREDLLLRILDVVQEAGTGFAFPSQTVYMAKDGGLDPEKSRLAAEVVRGLRSAGRLPFPDFPPAEVEAMADRLEYPPEGSALRPAMP